MALRCRWNRWHTWLSGTVLAAAANSAPTPRLRRVWSSTHNCCIGEEIVELSKRHTLFDSVERRILLMVIRGIALRS
jgi:hypothetical protein